MVAAPSNTIVVVPDMTRGLAYPPCLTTYYLLYRKSHRYFDILLPLNSDKILDTAGLTSIWGHMKGEQGSMIRDKINGTLKKYANH